MIRCVVAKDKHVIRQREGGVIRLSAGKLPPPLLLPPCFESPHQAASKTTLANTEYNHSMLINK